MFDVLANHVGSVGLDFTQITPFDRAQHCHDNCPIDWVSRSPLSIVDLLICLISIMIAILGLGVSLLAGLDGLLRRMIFMPLGLILLPIWVMAF
jgi:hypothetical protein